MSTAYRTELLERTRHIVSGRRRVVIYRWAAWAAVGAAGVIACALLLGRAGGPTVKVGAGLRPGPTEAGSADRRPDGPVRPAPLVVSNGGAGVSPANDTERVRGRDGRATKAAVTVAVPTATRPRAPFLAVIAARQPALDAAGRALKVGDRVGAGLVRTGASGRLTLITRRGSEFTLNQNSELQIASAKVATLRRGEIYCRSREHEIARVDTPAGAIHLLGTVIDATTTNSHKVAVTVVAGKVRLQNAHGQAVIPAGKRAVMVASAAPGIGATANTFAQTAWYDSRDQVVSEFGEIAYTVRRGDDLTEIWTMKADGSDKQRVHTYIGYAGSETAWLPGQRRLTVSTRSALWTTPDFAHHCASAGSGHPIVEDATWLVNAATGEDTSFSLPAGYYPLYTTMSPDAQRLAFCGGYRPEGSDRDSWQGGVWVYDIVSGGIKRALEGWIKTPVSWAPDSRRLAASTGQGYGSNYPLVVVDADTGAVTELKVQGVGTAFSPDGTKLAYCGDFKRTGSWYRGVLTSGSIFVTDLAPGGERKRISPAGEGALEPRWSPDGTRIAYWVNQGESVSPDDGPYYPGYTVFVARADGAGVKEIYRRKPISSGGGLHTVAWAPSGDALYLSTDDGVLLVAADGSGVRADLGGNDKDSVLSPAADAQTTAAIEAVREAVYQYAVGNVRLFEGRAADSRAAFQAAADGFAGLMWRYPLADLSTNDVLRYADKARKMANRSTEAILAASCKERMSYLGILLAECAGEAGQFPADLAALQAWSLTHGWGINWFSNRDTAWVKMIFRCPQGQPFVYTPPPAGRDPKIGDVVVTCPNHRDCRLVWDKDSAQRLQWQREIAARQAAGKAGATK